MIAPGIELEAAGGIAGQSAVSELRRPDGDLDRLWLRTCEVGARYGWKSPAMRAYVRELGKSIRDGRHA